MNPMSRVDDKPATDRAVRPVRPWPKGRIVRLDHRSDVLRGNPWNDPADRQVPVYLPPGYSRSAEPYLALWDLAAFTNAGPGHLNWRSHGENLPDRLDRLIGEGSLPPLVVVMPDCYSSLGGNQYINSVGVGRYADYLVQELVPFVGQELNVAGDRGGRGLFGKSSGGYGALYHGMHFSETWGAVASHAGDVGFDLVYRPSLGTACATLADYGGDCEAFVSGFWRKNRPDRNDFTTLMILAMAASYDPDSNKPGHVRLPCDLRTCSLDAERWNRWLAHDPLCMPGHVIDGLRNLYALYIDVGRSDEYHIQFGSRAFCERLKSREIEFRYEEFDGTHSAIDWRLDHSLPFLAKALKKARGAAS